MESFAQNLGEEPIAVGIAYCDYVPGLVRAEPRLVDYVEVPFELLIRDAKPSELLPHVPIVLHCASLSIAGNSPLPEPLVSRLEHWIRATNTSWVGEHLAFVRATEPSLEPAMADAVVLNERTNTYDVGYTVSPQYSEHVLERVVKSLDRAQQRFGLPVLLENGPLYVSMPGSTMTQIEFINALCDRLPSARLLLDLSHLEITAKNTGADSLDLLTQLPLERVVEVHLSGHSAQSGLHWDDHSVRAPQIVFELLAELLTRASPRAVTLEYNWDVQFPLDGLREDLGKVREITTGASLPTEA